MNFFQKGLAGLESRLDKVLLDETDQAALAREKEAKERERRQLSENEKLPATPPERSESPVPRRSGEGRDSGSSKMTMQERLAAAVARKNAAAARSSSPAGSNLGRSNSRSETPVGRERADSIKNFREGRASQDSRRDSREINGRGSSEVPAESEASEKISEKPEAHVEQINTEDTTEVVEIPSNGSPAVAPVEEITVDDPAIEPPKPPSQQTNGDGHDESKSFTPDPTPASAPQNSTSDASREELEATIASLQEDILICETRRQEENHAASERIDALEEKLRYLARESAEASRRRATSAPAGDLQKKLAEQEEKVALLLEEGERLSKNELKLQNTIKKLRAKTQDEEKATKEAKRKQEKAEKEAADAKEKIKKAQENEKKAQERAKSLAKIEAEVDVLRREKETLTSETTDLKEKLDEMTKRADDAESRVQTEALEKEKKITIELRAQVDRVQSEATMTEERLNGEIRDLKDKMERGNEKARRREAELKGEQSVMESKVEALRARIEEASSGATGDAHAKLLRQVETLQTQYAIAQENWQGIEGTLLSRVASLERERDDLAKKESDIRRRAREMNLKSKNLEMDLESSQSKTKDLESELKSQTELVGDLKKRLSEFDSTLQESKETFRRERDTWQRDLQSKLDEERAKWEEAYQASPPSPQLQAPSIRKITTPISATESYFLGHQRKPPSRPVSTEPPDQSPQGRKQSHGAGFRTPPIPPGRLDASGRLDSSNSLNGLGGFTRTSLPPSSVIGAEEDGDFFEGVTPMSPQRHPDMASVSTVAAGPSVQLVERMSAAVRQLESEKAGFKEEIARMTAQRDEARQEIVELMREVETKRVADEKLIRLENELREMEVKQDEALVMLGEKSERVEELEADVADLKQMYRDLVNSTIR